MRILCVFQNYPDELEPIAAHFADLGDASLLMASQRQPHNVSKPQFRRVLLKKCDAVRFPKDYLGYLALAVKTAQNADSAFETIQKTGFEPDLVLACASNGIALGLGQRFPDSFLISYADTKLGNLYCHSRQLFDARRGVQTACFEQSQLCFARFSGQIKELSPACDYLKMGGGGG